MRGRVNAAVAGLVLFLVCGLAVLGLRSARNTAVRSECINNLKQIGLGVHGYHDTYKCFPQGTVPCGDLPPQDRLGWLVSIWPAFMVGGFTVQFDKAKPWDAPENCPPPCFVRRYTDASHHRLESYEPGDITYFLCPANPTRTDPPLPCVTHYVGIAGVGDGAAELPLSDPRAGFFGYDRKLTLGDVKDGTSMTLMAAEVLEGGPWTAGGPATVRGLSSATPYLGDGGQFASRHEVTNVVFADASVRSFTASVAPQVFEALATVAGNESVDLPDG